MLHEELKQSADHLMHYLHTQLTPSGFEARTFYGEIFTLLGCEYSDSECTFTQDLVKGHVEKLKTLEEARQHQEFHLYAYSLLSSTYQAFFDAPNLHFKHTIRAKPTNWILLRGIAKIRFGSIFEKQFWKWILPIVIQYNTRDGFILDRGIGAMIRKEEKDVYLSDQYQAFILVLLADLFDLTKNPFYLTSFEKGLTALLSHQTETGEIIRSGRGRKQIFGYGSILYALSWSIIKQHKDENISSLQQIFKHVRSFQNTDGSFPLVLTKGDDPSLWERYNNLFDYLPFLATMLYRSAHLLKKDSVS